MAASTSAASSSSRNSARCRRGLTPAAAYCPVTGLVTLRGLNPLYGVFLVNQLGVANRQERVQAMESVFRHINPSMVPGLKELTSSSI